MPMTELPNEIGAETPPLQTARLRRMALHEAMEHMEFTLARASRTENWVGEVERALNALQDAMEAHIVDVEAPDGLLNEMIEVAPRLSGEIDVIRREHAELTTLWQKADVAVHDPGRDSFRIRRVITALLGGLAEHRQRGSDLVYDAYNVDIGAAD